MDPLLYDYPELKALRVLVDASQVRLAELEVAYTVEKAGVDSLQASLFKRLRVHSQERDRLRLVTNYRKQCLELLLRKGDAETEQVEQEFRHARARIEQEYEETAQTFAARREMSEEEQTELRKLWKKLVGLYHPDASPTNPTSWRPMAS